MRASGLAAAASCSALLLLAAGGVAPASAATPAPCVDDERGWLSTSTETCASLVVGGKCAMKLGDVFGKNAWELPQSVHDAPVSSLCRASCPFACVNWYDAQLACADSAGEAKCAQLTKELTCAGNDPATKLDVYYTCRRTCGSCPIVPQPPTENCEDDPFDALTAAAAASAAAAAVHNGTCASAVAAVGCAGRLAGFSQATWELCPSTCGTCLSVAPRDRVTFCADDPLGFLAGATAALNGTVVSCETLGVLFGCKGRTVAANGFPAYEVSALCPHMCGACPDRQGEGKNCRALLTDLDYQVASGAPMTWRYVGALGQGRNMFQGGVSGDPGMCQDMSMVTKKKKSGRWCSVTITFYDAFHLCVPDVCGFNDVVDFMRERGNGTYLGGLNGFCQDDNENMNGGGSEYETLWTPAVVVTVIFTGVLALFVFLSSTFDHFAAMPIVRHWNFQASCADLLSVRKGSTSFLDCIRVISLLLIVLAHVQIYTNINRGFSNKLSMQESIHGWGHGIFVYGFPGYAVDSFFFMSAFLGTVITSKLVYRDQNKRHFKNAVTTIRGVLFSYVQRYLRLVPLMMFFVAFSLNIVPLLGSSPMWGHYLTFARSEPCRKDWWRQLLLITDSNDWPNHECWGHLWYISVDFHFSLLLPFLVMPFAIAKHVKTKIVAVHRVLYAVVPCIVIIFVSVMLVRKQDLSRLNATYVRPWLRVSPYCYGVLAAVVYEVLLEKRKADGERFFSFLRRCSGGSGGSSRAGLEAAGEPNTLEEELSERLDVADEDQLVVRGDGSTDRVVALHSRPPHGVDYNNLDTMYVAKKRQREVPEGANHGQAMFVSPEAGIALRYFSYVLILVLMISAGRVVQDQEAMRDLNEPVSNLANDNGKSYYMLSWGLALLMLTVNFSLGYGGPVRKVMSLPIWSCLGKLSYGAYLVHPMLLMTINFDQTPRPMYSPYWLVFQAGGVALMAYATAFVFWCLVEKPFGDLLSFTKKKGPAGGRKSAKAAAEVPNGAEAAATSKPAAAIGSGTSSHANPTSKEEAAVLAQ